MAFSNRNFGVISAGGPVVILEDGTYIGNPSVCSYLSITDTLATVSAVNYFSPIASLVNVGDYILISASDGAQIFTVASINVALGLITVSSNVGLGDVVGPATSTNNALARWSGTNGKLLANGPGTALDGTGNLTVNSLTVSAGQTIALTNPANTFTTSFTSGAVTTNNAYTTPSALPTVSGQVLSSTTSGIQSWITLPDSSWIDQTSTPMTMALNTAYIADTAGLLTFNVPTVVPAGTEFEVAGKGAGGWLIQFATGQTGHLNSSATSVAGSLASTNQWNSIRLVCVTANTTFTVVSSSGNITNA